jgi:ribosomal protein S14
MTRTSRAEPAFGPDDAALPFAEPDNAVTEAARRNACAHCGRPFGLVRHRLAIRQFCSKACLTAETAKMQRTLKEKVRRLAHLPGRG